jgi:hypothetical protein
MNHVIIHLVSMGPLSVRAGTLISFQLSMFFSDKRNSQKNIVLHVSSWLSVKHENVSHALLRYIQERH